MRCRRPFSIVSHSVRPTMRGHDIERQDPLAARAVAVDVEGDAGVEERALGGLLAAAEIAVVEGFDHADERLGGATDLAVALEHLIEELLVFVAAESHGAWFTSADAFLGKAPPAFGETSCGVAHPPMES